MLIVQSYICYSVVFYTVILVRVIGKTVKQGSLPWNGIPKNVFLGVVWPINISVHDSPMYVGDYSLWCMDNCYFALNFCMKVNKGNNETPHMYWTL